MHKLRQNNTGKDMSTPERIVTPLLAWYENNARTLPWRSDRPNAYHVWVSEIMLQQTRVEAVKPYFARFISALPDIASLAEVEDELLMQLWEGLGYYSRARNLKRAAADCMARYQGRLPMEYAALLSLAGIGAYTAGAIASIAYGVPVPAVDGNVLRVLARLNNDASDIALPATKRAACSALQAIIPKNRAGAFNQALMELGALICLPNGAPKCGVCPLESLCLAHAANTVGALPVKAKKAARRKEQHTVFVLHSEQGIVVCKRPNSGLLAGLWELPHTDGTLDADEMTKQLAAWGMQPTGEIASRNAKHIFTHIEWHMRVYDMPVACAALPTGWEWTPKEGGRALPSAFRVCMAKE